MNMEARRLRDSRQRDERREQRALEREVLQDIDTRGLENLQ